MYGGLKNLAIKADLGKMVIDMKKNRRIAIKIKCVIFGVFLTWG